MKIYQTLFIIISVYASKITLNERKYFQDENGAIRIFHGFNVVYKQPPYIPKTEGFDYMETFSEIDCQIIRDNGFNVIRLHVSFEGAMPKKGELDEKYLDKILMIVRMTAKYNIYVILDAHQDLYNRQFCGNGFPDWATQKTDFPSPNKMQMRFDSQGYPLLEDCYQQQFALFYQTNDIGRHFELLYSNHDGLADYFGQFWQLVADKHKNEWNVIGYDIFNEPSPGHFEKSKIDFLWPGHANNKYLLPFYKLIHNYIRKVDNEKLIFFAPDFLDAFGGGFDKNIGGQEYINKEVFSYHVYCGIQKISSWFCNKIHQLIYFLKMRNVEHLKIGGFLTEFGALENDEDSIYILNYILDKADSYQQSWAYWQYKGYYDYTTMSTMYEEGLFNEDGTFQNKKIISLKRPYAYQICADYLESNQYYSDTKEFILQFKSKQGCQTKVFIPKELNQSQIFDYKCQNCQLFWIEDQHYEVVGEGEIDLYFQL
ncbi:unnamed protein product [Paramecium pentaurelia]|uniref:Glycoside hydrolase family 5 domain-containing protein n=1 Tax=Paramecium pentaurelia TaxID=43138 RepID=A0A8S1XQ36_9CILI|nr:unnamed protein product [Paramecium pentaurelia]